MLYLRKNIKEKNIKEHYLRYLTVYVSGQMPYILWFVQLDNEYKDQQGRALFTQQKPL
jgi:hypothetical protein